MTIKDFFDFDEYEYAHRISTYDITRLRTQEVVKLRQQVSGSVSILVGAGSAPATGGVSLCGAAYGTRRFYVAHKKHALIKAELQRRNIDPHEPRMRDVLIPITANIVGNGFGDGLDYLIPTGTSNDLIGPAITSGTLSVTDQLVLQVPSDSLHTCADGVQEQPHAPEIRLAETIQPGVVPGDDAATHVLSQHTTKSVDVSPAEYVEKSAVSITVGYLSQGIMESVSSHTRPLSQSSSCIRSHGILRLQCDHCNEIIKQGGYWRTVFPLLTCYSSLNPEDSRHVSNANRIL